MLQRSTETTIAEHATREPAARAIKYGLYEDSPRDIIWNCDLGSPLSVR
jgi:spore coat protein U-like protein